MKESATILIIFLLGIGCGYLGYVPEQVFSPILTASVAIILFSAGVSIGLNKSVFMNIRYHGIRAIILPLSTMLSVLLCNSILWLCYGTLSFAESLVVGSGFAYYSLSSALLEKLFSTDLATLALLTNMFIEIWALLLAPLLCLLFGPLAPIAVSGVSAMDVCLPVIMRTSGKEFFLYATIHGVIMTLATPLFIYFFYFLSQLLSS